MTIEVNGTTVEVLGKAFKVKCPPHEIPALQKAAAYLEEKMREVREVHHVLSVDRLAIIVALNMTHQLLSLEHEQIVNSQHTQARLKDLYKRIDQLLPVEAETECDSE
jgi:cell division protein ZapA